MDRPTKVVVESEMVLLGHFTTANAPNTVSSNARNHHYTVNIYKLFCLVFTKKAASFFFLAFRAFSF